MYSIFTQPTLCFAEGSQDLQLLLQDRWKIAPPALGKGLVINSVPELLMRIAELRNAHPSRRLMFRGQRKDYQIKWAGGQSSTFLYPSALREQCLRREDVAFVNGEEFSGDLFRNLSNAVIRILEATLHTHHPNRSKEKAVTTYEALGIAQHYEMMPTTMLDVTSDWRTACCFSRNDDHESYLYVLSLPDFDEPISIKIDENVVIVDLARVCPPNALRPHFQNGFAISTFPDTGLDDHKLKSKIGNPPRNWDFSTRLLAKFRLSAEFWNDEYAPKESLNLFFPDTIDPIFKFTNGIRGPILGMKPAQPYEAS